jgi:6-phosphogluconolactonase
MSPEVVVSVDAERLAQSVADRLIALVLGRQRDRGEASVVVTGGRVGTAVLAAVAESSTAKESVDWQKIDVWWGDERFLPSGDPDRNETQARKALLDYVPLDSARVFAMPASDGPDGDDVDAAAVRYAETLVQCAQRQDGGSVPRFDVVMLGVGPDGHIASLFPGLPGPREVERSVIGVRNSPKPPPTRISMTFPTLDTATEVWLVVAGEDKAQAVRQALEGTPKEQIPAAGVRGRQRTVWFIDQAAATELPQDIERVAAP